MSTLTELIAHAEHELLRAVPVPDAAEELLFSSSAEPWRGVLPAQAQASFIADFDNFGYSYDLIIVVTLNDEQVFVRAVCSSWSSSGSSVRWDTEQQGDAGDAQNMISELAVAGSAQLDKLLKAARNNARRRLSREQK